MKQTGTKNKSVLKNASLKNAKSLSKAKEGKTIEVKLGATATLPKLTTKSLKPFKDIAKKNKKLKAKKKAISKDFYAKPSRKGKYYNLDLRLRTPESLSIISTSGIKTAPALARLSKVKGLDYISTADYHDCALVEPLAQACKETGMGFLPGVCINCHVTEQSVISNLVLFPEDTTSEYIANFITDLGIPDSARGSSDYALKVDYLAFLKRAEKSGAVVIPSRIDLTPHHLLSIPTLVEKFGFHVFDLAHSGEPSFFEQRWPKGKFTFFSFSNASSLAQVGSRMSKVKLEKPGFEGLKKLVKRRKR